MHYSKYYYIRKYFMLLNLKVFLLSKAFPPACSKSFSWNNQIFKVYHMIPVNWNKTSQYHLSPYTGICFYLELCFMKNNKADCRSFPTQGTFSNHLLSSQILWCSGIASIVSAWRSRKKKNSFIDSCLSLKRPIKASARGRLIEQREWEHFLTLLLDWSLINSIWCPPFSGDFPHGIWAGFPLMTSTELWQTYILASHFIYRNSKWVLFYSKESLLFILQFLLIQDKNNSLLHIYRQDF